MALATIIVIACGVLALLYGLVASRQVLAADAGNARMQEIGNAIQEGARAYLNRQYITIGGVGVVILVLLAATLGMTVAIGFAIGWWPSFGSSSGAYIKFNGDGSATIVTGAQECGSGAVMALPRLAAAQLGMQPEDFSIVYQDTESGPYDMGASGSQTTFNNGRAVMRARHFSTCSKDCMSRYSYAL